MSGIRDRVRVGITGAFGVPEENYNGKRVFDFCAERGCVWVTHASSTRVYIATLGWLGTKTEWS